MGKKKLNTSWDHTVTTTEEKSTLVFSLMMLALTLLQMMIWVELLSITQLWENIHHILLHQNNQSLPLNACHVRNLQKKMKTTMVMMLMMKIELLNSVSKFTKKQENAN